MVIVSGLCLCLWRLRGDTAWAQVLVPNLRARRRTWRKSPHASVAFWLNAVLLVTSLAFPLSGAVLLGALLMCCRACEA